MFRTSYNFRQDRFGIVYCICRRRNQITISMHLRLWWYTEQIPGETHTRCCATTRSHAWHCQQHLSKKRYHFATFMTKLFDNDNAEKAPTKQSTQEQWFLPLFGVYHPQKPNQIRGYLTLLQHSKGPLWTTNCCQVLTSLTVYWECCFDLERRWLRSYLMCSTCFTASR